MLLKLISHELNRSILEASVDAILVLNEEAKVEVFNESAERLFGYTQKEIIGQHVSILMPHAKHEKPVKKTFSMCMCDIFGCLLLLIFFRSCNKVQVHGRAVYDCTQSS